MMQRNSPIFFLAFGLSGCAHHFEARRLDSPPAAVPGQASSTAMDVAALAHARAENPEARRVATVHLVPRRGAGPDGVEAASFTELVPVDDYKVTGVPDDSRTSGVGAPLKPGTSLDSLSPRDTVIAAVNDLSMRQGVRLPSIIGDRGRGGPPERSSDGVVHNASSHLPQAESERIVPAGHTGTLARPETADELIRILTSTGH